MVTRARPSREARPVRDTSGVDVAELVLRYIQALAWPIVVVVLAVLFRRGVRAAVGRLTELSGPGLSAKFESDAEAMAVRAAAVAHTPYVPPPPPAVPVPPARTDPTAWQDEEQTRTVTGGPESGNGSDAAAERHEWTRPPAQDRVRDRFAAARAAAETDPLAAIRLAWDEVERGIEDVTYAQGVTGLIRELARMRGEALARPGMVTAAAARAYVNAAEAIVSAQVRATGRLP